MPTGDTRLLSGTALTAADLERAQFPMAIIGGYRVNDVEAFRSRVISALGQLHRALTERSTNEQELASEVRRLQGILDQGGTVPTPAAQENGQSAGRVLTLAQRNAEQLVGEAQQQAASIVAKARHDAEQLAAHARQQAEQVLAQATADGEAERARIIEAGTADARRTASGFRVLSEEMAVGLREIIENLVKQAAEWDGRATEVMAPPQAARTANGTGPQRQRRGRAAPAQASPNPA